MLPRMRRHPLTLVVVLATACVAPKSTQPPTPPAPRTQSVAAKTPSPSPAKPTPLTAAPDVPKGATAARDAELAKTAKVVLEAFSNTGAASATISVTSCEPLL